MPQPVKTSNPMIDEAIETAKTLERQRSTLMQEIGANREFLRVMDRAHVLTDEQADWLDDFYPQKEKGERRSAEDIARTREAKAAARAAA